MGKTRVEKVDLKEQVAWMGGKEYWYELDEDEYAEEMLRKWFTTSKKYVYVDDEKVSIEELDELDPGNTDWTPAEVPVKNPEKLKVLDDAVDRAEAQEPKKKRSAAKTAPDKGEPPDALEERAEAKSKTEGKRSKQPSKHTFNFAFKSATSDYVLNFRIAPSKKHKDLHNVSVHLGSKFLGYVEVPWETVAEFRHRLRRLE